MKKILFICIMGPTACGKTSLGIEVAKKINGEIISVDSALVYRGMDIGTAKPTQEERQGIVHHLIDIKNPIEPYSAADFRSDALLLIKDINSRGKVPILVGGTMLYFRSLLVGISNLPSSKPEIRKSIEDRIEKEGINQVHQYLCNIDPIAGGRIKINDKQRLVRALEVYEMTGKNITTWYQENQPKAIDIPNIQFALMPKSKEYLRELIKKRFDLMIKNGLIDEVKSLFKDPKLNADLPSIRSVGYRQCWSYLNNEYNFDEFVYRGFVATCQLAKHQMTWIKGWEQPITTLISEEPNNLDVILNKYNEFIK